MKKLFITLGIAGIMAISSCSPVKSALINSKEEPVYEIAVRQVKDGMKDDFVTARYPPDQLHLQSSRKEIL